ncbi:unnamed protein product [Penicillium salamii]|uniref:Phenol 2-monooxygenase n=1 Tax=Penicillium salamii TaxID=1612424 RepID=A0A9W4JRJ5_9EURO|nr:unnamed protein product [Penicillium salamii]CAG8030191.1 unnamed protein product [Penicillium salamii]CAG8173268.1 unnamed protein product [Penicillium salamii]CAG8218321.1 unnamed protein product [Penicillium salamii]CAG8228494.1 unnamed protein product [Penicillium salamii]
METIVLRARSMCKIPRWVDLHGLIISRLVIGAGPSGLMAAYWMARCGINARIIDKRETKIFVGHADGLRPRTLELFDSMGFQHRVLHEASESTEVNLWGPGDQGKLVRQALLDMTQADHSPYHNTRLSQGRIERFILDSIHENSDLRVERSVVTETLEYEEKLGLDPEAYPITVKLRTLSPEELNTPNSDKQNFETELTHEDLLQDDWDDLGQRGSHKEKVETVKAKYLIGCDGAHSWTRKQLEIPTEGSNTDHIWGVIDVIAISNFRKSKTIPHDQLRLTSTLADIRRVSVVTGTTGTILVIPRERGITRFYVPVQTCEAGTSDRFDRSIITPKMIKSRVQEIIAPYTFEFEVCDWWTVYQIGQRIATQVTRGDRIFLAGDAVHTHSPKMGLGMNMSLQDGFNLGWKVALAAAGTIKPETLKTYELERHPLAKMLIEFDRHWVNLFLDVEPGEKDTKAESMAAMSAKFENFAHGWNVYYPASNIVSKSPEHGDAAIPQNFVPGERIHPFKLRNQADGCPQWTTRLLKSDGRFRILLLAGDVRDSIQKQRIETFTQALGSRSASGSPLLDRYTGIPGRFESPIDIFTIHCSPWKEVEFFDFPEVLRPLSMSTGYAYDKIWCDDACIFDRYCDGTAYEKWGVDRALGTLVVIRPDQYIGWMGNIEDVEEMTRYFDGVLVRKPPVSEIPTVI